MPNLSSLVSQSSRLVTTNSEVTLTNKTLTDPIIQYVAGDTSFTVPSGTTAERPSSPETGELRFNTDEGSLEQYDGTNWGAVVPDDLDINTLSINGSEVVDSSGNITGTLVTAAQPNITSVGTLTDVIATNYNETVGTITSSDVDLSTGNVFEETISANTTYTFSNPPSSGTAFGFTLRVTASGGAYTITWPGSVDWAGGEAPDAPADGETDVYAFFTTDGGTTYYGFQAGDALA